LNATVDKNPYAPPRIRVAARRRGPKFSWRRLVLGSLLAFAVAFVVWPLCPAIYVGCGGRYGIGVSLGLVWCAFGVLIVGFSMALVWAAPPSGRGRSR
jgi:hypothetical protein